MRIALNNGWEFTEQFSQPFLNMEIMEGVVSVRLPHTCRQTPYDYFDEGIYQMVCGYRRKLAIPESWTGKRLFLRRGAMRNTETGKKQIGGVFPVPEPMPHGGGPDEIQ